MLTQIQSETEANLPVSSMTEKEKNHGRETKRMVEVYKNSGELEPGWKGVKTFVKVTREELRGSQVSRTKTYYISSKMLDAKVFATGIRGHWQIENQLHWVKDVVFKEDSSTRSQKNAATNCSVIKTILLNILRFLGYTGITQAQRWLANDLSGILELLRE